MTQGIDTSDGVINLSLDEWIGWKPIIDANQGLTTQPGSIFDNLGLKVNINIINDADASSNALIKGDLNAAGYTLNRTAFLSGKFADAGLDVVMPVFTNYSNGGDGIIALNEFDSIESLVDAKIGVPKFSEAQSLVIWFVNKSDLSDADKQKIIDNLILLDDAEQTGQAFFAGSLDVAATWQPYLSNAENSTNSHILFSTASSNKLIMDGILFRSDFAEANPEVISKFIDGIFQAESMYETEFKYIREVMPMFADSSDEDIKAMCGDAGLMGYMLNRQAMMDEIINGMKLHVEEQFTTIHNYIDTDSMILRKGAVSAKVGEQLLIPINMRDGSLLCVGKGNKDWNYSAPHGAGRLMSRAAAKQSFTVSEFKKQMVNVYTTSVNQSTLEECPMAYKGIQDILDNITPTAEVKKIIRPIYNFKAGE